jgi:hypothetical protein
MATDWRLANMIITLKLIVPTILKYRSKSVLEKAMR